eukprot:XP_011429806.2 PREDICTED: uncharacterized protein LOC105329985 [Crassostrea gigas]
MPSPTPVQCVLLYIAIVVTCLQKDGICFQDSLIEKSRKTYQPGINWTQTSTNIDVSNRAWLPKESESPEIMRLEGDLEVGYEGHLNPTCKMNLTKSAFSSKSSEEDVQEGITSTPTKPNTFPSHGIVRESRRHMRRSNRTGNRKKRFVRIAMSSGTLEVEITRRRKRQMLETESAPNIRRKFKTHRQRKESSIRKFSKFFENRRGGINRRSRRYQRRERKIKSALTNTGRVPTKIKKQTIRLDRKKSITEYLGQIVRRFRYSVGRNERHSRKSVRQSERRSRKSVGRNERRSRKSVERNERRSRKSVGRYIYRSRIGKTRRSKSNVERIVHRANNNINRNKRHSRNITGRFVQHIKNSFSLNLRHLRSIKGRQMRRSGNGINRSVTNSRNTMRRTGHRSRSNINRNTQRTRNRIGRVVRHIKNSMRRVVRHTRVIYRRDIENEILFVVRRRRKNLSSKSKAQKSMLEKSMNDRRNTQLDCKDSLKNFPLNRGRTLPRRRFSRVQRYCLGLHSSSACSVRKVKAFRNHPLNSTQNGEKCHPRIKQIAKTRRGTPSYRVQKGSNSFNTFESFSPGIAVKSTELFEEDNESCMFGPLDAFYKLANKIKRFGTRIKGRTPDRSELFAKSNKHILGILGLALWMTSRQTSA